jgi:hypothetical protein
MNPIENNEKGGGVRRPRTAVPKNKKRILI